MIPRPDWTGPEKMKPGPEVKTRIDFFFKPGPDQKKINPDRRGLYPTGKKNKTGPGPDRTGTSLDFVFKLFLVRRQGEALIQTWPVVFFNDVFVARRDGGRAEPLNTLYGCVHIHKKRSHNGKFDGVPFP